MKIYIKSYHDRCTVGRVLIDNGYSVSSFCEKNSRGLYDDIKVGLKIERMKEEENET